MADRQEFRGRVDFKKNVKSKYLLHTEPVEATVAVDGSAQNVDVSFTQPANTVLTKCTIICTDSPTIASGDIGYAVGTSAGGGQIIAAITDEILDGGTTVALGAVTYPGMGVSLPAGDAAAQAKVAIDAAIAGGIVHDVQNDATHVASVAYTSAARTVHCRISVSSECTAAGKFVFLWEWIQLADAASNA